MNAMRGLTALALLIAGMPVSQAAGVDIHPSGPVVPENLLRIELRFSRPQQLPFDVEHRVRLLDASGLPMAGALLDLALPSADGRRITVLMDPGRVKRGVGPNLDAGRALRAGESVILRVDGDVAGEPPMVKHWTVAKAQSLQLQPGSWTLSLPRAGSRDALVVDLRDAISSTGERLIAVINHAGQRVNGHVALTDSDTVWRFTPTRRWRVGAYTLVVHPDLEDPAGNRQCAPFEQVRISEMRCGTGASLRFEPMLSIKSRR